MPHQSKPDEPMPDEPMPGDSMPGDSMPDDPMTAQYDQWIASRQAVDHSPDLTDRIMTAVQDRRRHVGVQVQLADRVNESMTARWAACAAALVVGILPFLFVAYMAELLVI